MHFSRTSIGSLRRCSKWPFRVRMSSRKVYTKFSGFGHLYTSVIYYTQFELAVRSNTRHYSSYSRTSWNFAFIRCHFPQGSLLRYSSELYTWVYFAQFWGIHAVDFAIRTAFTSACNPRLDLQPPAARSASPSLFNWCRYLHGKHMIVITGNFMN